MRFVAVDVEKLDHDPGSICAIGVVEVHEGRIVGRRFRALRPATMAGRFPWSPCLPRSALASKPTFPDERPWIERALMRADFITAHNATFDLNLLENGFRAAGSDLPRLDYVCTLQLSRRLFPLERHRLPDVCEYLRIPLEHHNALSDAEACARIILAAGPDAVTSMIRRWSPQSSRRARRTTEPRRGTF